MVSKGAVAAAILLLAGAAGAALVLVKRTKATSGPWTVTFTVYGNGVPLRNAFVEVTDGIQYSGLTDANGQYTVEVPQTQSIAVVAVYTGYTQFNGAFYISGPASIPIILTP